MKKLHHKHALPLFAAAFVLQIIIFVSGYMLYMRNKKVTASALPKNIQLRIPPVATPTPTPVPAIIKLPIITYHYVEYVQNPRDTVRMKLDINPFNFEAQLKGLRDTGYKTFFVKEIPDIIKANKPLEGKNIVLTFDDGYEDFYLNVFPLLKKYQMKGTIYVISGYIGRKGFLTEKELKEIIESGIVEVGSHTVDHFDLRTLPRDKANKEITDSKLDLEKRFGIEVKTFAYPGGTFKPETVELVKEASYEAAVSTKAGLNVSTDSLYVLPRIRAGYMVIQSIQDFFSKIKI